MLGRVYRCEGGYTSVREGIHVLGRVYRCEGGYTSVREGIQV